MRTNRKTRRIRLFSIAIIIYMLAAFTWWALLLRKKTIKYHNLQIELVESKPLDPEEKRLQLEKIEHELSLQNRMILGEAIFFGLSLSIGLWFVYRSYRQAIQVSKNQTNFLLAITHELKTPIASISLILETLIKRKINEDQKQKMGSDAMRETRRLDSLVNNLLLSARLDSKYKPFPEWLDLCGICEKIVAEYRGKYPEAEFAISCGKDLPMVYADKEGMIAIIHNLLGNAIKYSENTPRVEINITSTDQNIELKVADHGIGIPEAEKKKVFERFYRSGNEAIRKTKGTGLGLFIIREIVRAHRGKIRLENNVPSGTVFIITLPIE
ncbi:MAG: HAMP domain-containing histidine kinase [Saprospiraceae bacterium]|nr:HAMP domain-containing histidine kinase [Saprospiraceae bacterium]MCB9323541.1 HAMP domain-containing histidine kinase [Lewinellaceae bacterium]